MTDATTPIAPAPSGAGVSRAARIRACVAGAVVALAIIGIGYRAWALQVGDADHYRADRRPPARGPRRGVGAARRHPRRAPAGRPLAISADADSVWASPPDVLDVTATADRARRAARRRAGRLRGQARFAAPVRVVGSPRPPEIAAAVRAAQAAGHRGRARAAAVVPGARARRPGARRRRRRWPRRRRHREGARRAADRQARRGHRAARRARPRDGRGRAARRTGRDRAAHPRPQIQAIADAAIADAVVTHHATSGVAVVLDVATSPRSRSRATRATTPTSPTRAAPRTIARSPTRTRPAR